MKTVMYFSFGLHSTKGFGSWGGDSGTSEWTWKDKVASSPPFCMYPKQCVTCNVLSTSKPSSRPQLSKRPRPLKL
eukprot:278952-Amphidinium_carterae.1